MGPFFALGRTALGARRGSCSGCGSALVLALAAWGAVRLMDELAAARAGSPHAVAGAAVRCSTRTWSSSAARTSVTLLGYAALPWLLLCVHRGLRAPRSWWWPAAFALIVTRVGRRRERRGDGVGAARAAAARAVRVAGRASRVARGLGLRLADGGWRPRRRRAWWVVPLLVQSRYGVDFLRFTEQPGTIWSTTSLPESLRLMGYWISYLGVGYGGELRPYFGGGGVLLFALPVVLAGLLVPALALAGFAWTRKLALRAFALLLVLVGLIVDDGRVPRGHTAPPRVELYVQPFRPSPVPAHDLQGGAAGGARAWRCSAGLRGDRASARWRAAPLVGAAPCVACWPLVARARAGRPAAVGAGAAGLGGRGGPRRRARRRRPRRRPARPALRLLRLGRDDRPDPAGARRQARRDPQRRAATRTCAPPTCCGPSTRWSSSAARSRASSTRCSTCWAPARCWPAPTTTATRSGAAPAAEAADVLDQLGAPDAAWGPCARAPARRGHARRAARAAARPRLGPPGRARPRARGARASRRRSSTAPPRASPRWPRSARSRSRRLLYAGDLTPREIAPRRGGEVVITDSNRRRVLVASRLAQNAGPVLAADEEPSMDAAVLDPFPGRGTDAQTVAVYDGIAGDHARRPRPASRSSRSAGRSRRIDGDPATHWQADRRARRRTGTRSRSRSTAPRDVADVELLPYNDRRATVTAVEVQGRRFDVKPGWNRLELGARGRARRCGSGSPPCASPRARRPARAGFASCGSPGVDGARGAAAAGAGRARARRPRPARTADATCSSARPATTRSAATPRARLVRRRARARPRSTARPASRACSTRPPRARGRSTAGRAPPRRARRRARRARRRARPCVRRRSAALRGAARVPGVERVRRHRAAVDRRVARRAATRGSSGPRRGETASGRSRLRPGPGRAPADARPADADGAAPVAGRGTTAPCALPQPRPRARVPARDPARRVPARHAGTTRQRRAVGIAEIRGGVPTVSVPRSGAADGATASLTGTLGEPRAPAARRRARSRTSTPAVRCASRGCEPRRSCPPARRGSSSPPACSRRTSLRLRSPAPRRAARRARAASSTPARADRSGGRTGIRLDLDGPARLVLAESYNRGRRASCDGEDLGEPEVGARLRHGLARPATLPGRRDRVRAEPAR